MTSVPANARIFHRYGSESRAISHTSHTDYSSLSLRHPLVPTSPIHAPAAGQEEMASPLSSSAALSTPDLSFFSNTSYSLHFSGFLSLIPSTVGSSVSPCLTSPPVSHQETRTAPPPTTTPRQQDAYNSKITLIMLQLNINGMHNKQQHLIEHVYIAVI